ncbi:glycosyltransferase [Sphingobium bisphenolivorans]|uniref:glycosyltransferase n=1 Tax=Sphingobium bisphenolivorans TaxID=1335760 RepID=UPI0003AACE78|nr:glycosyltransferase [Sphingobium bisphenolivorans]
MRVAVGIFAHQEERRIAACLASLPLDRPGTLFHVLVNGSKDATAERAREAAGGRANVLVHDLPSGGKSRTWNRFIHELLTGEEEAVICLDGDAQIRAGSIDALAKTLTDGPRLNAAAGMPLNGRSAAAYRESLRHDRGLFGDLYALSGFFVRSIRQQELRLPEDLIGDDGLVAAWAHTNLGPDAAWDRDRIMPCEAAGFLCEPVSLLHPATIRMQYCRLINYSVRFFQNRIISDIMAREGPQGLPVRLSSLYPQWLPRFRPRALPTGWFDRKALARMRGQMEGNR